MRTPTLLTLALAFALSTANAAETRLASFGLITDTHVCDKTDQAPTITLNATARYFTGALPKMEAFARSMEQNHVDFIAHLGDMTDNPANSKLNYEQRKAMALEFIDQAEARLAQFKGPRYHVFGNHDTDQLSKQDIASHISNSGIAAGNSYYSFNRGGIHVIALDADYTADNNAYSGVPGSTGAGYQWSDANIPAKEIAWLKQDLASNQLPVIVLSHQFLNPAEQIDAQFDPAHSVKNAAEIRSLLENSGRVLAVFAGHYHDGDFQQINGISYIGLQANAAYGNDVSYHNQYALVEVRGDGKHYQVTVQGNGLQKPYLINRNLP